MRLNLRFLSACILLLESGGLLCAAEFPEHWKNVQTLQIPRTGLIKVSVPLETLSAARPGLEDLRLYDETGKEIPFLIEHPAPTPAAVQAAKRFDVAISAAATVVTLETGFAEPIVAITLQTPAPSFLKAARVEGSQSGKEWKVLADGQPVFRQQNGTSQLDIALQPARWNFLRLTLDDRRAAPIPVTGAILRAGDGRPAPEESLGVALVRRSEEPGLTRLALRFDGANCVLAGLSIETSDALFTRSVALAQQQFVDGEVREGVLHRETLSRVAPAGAANARLRFASGVTLRNRDLSLLITNDDNPPLAIAGIHAWRRPVYLTFNASATGACYLLSGNPSCVAPRYDLAFLRASLADAVLVPATTGALVANPNHRPTDPLADIEALGPPLAVDRWSFRKALPIGRDGVQRVELDLEVLSRAMPGLRDLRIVRDGRQIPFVLEHTPVERSFAPRISKADDPQRPTFSRWQFKLPVQGVPISKLTCAVAEPYFKRNVRLVEMRRDERGRMREWTLGSAAWQRGGGGGKPADLALALSSLPESDELFLELENGDNPPLTLQAGQAWHPVARLIFKSASTPGTWLYYGNPEAARPQYDLELVLPRLLAADSDDVKAGAEEILKPAARRRSDAQSGWIFWGALGLVVVGLLLVLTRLLPKPPEQKG